MENRRYISKLVIFSVCLAAATIGMIVSAYLLSRFMLKVQTTETTERSITVKGVAEKEVTSDLATFRASITITATDRKAGYAELDKASKALCAHLDKLGFTAAMREDANMNCEAQYETKNYKDDNGKSYSVSKFIHYELTYSVRVRTTDVKLVESNVLKVNELISQNYEVAVSAPQYFISNPERYKLDLVDQASASAAERARTAAQHSGSKLGPLMVARQGVIQITAPASNDTSDYGVYNTSTPQKVIRLVMTMEFELK